MHDVDLWVEKVCAEYYEDLYVVGIRFLVSIHSREIALLPDDIQEVYLLLCKGKEKLIHNPNIIGWLVVTLKSVIADRVGKANKEKERIAFSINDDAKSRQVRSLRDPDSDPLNILVNSSKDNLLWLEQEIGSKNLELLQRYYQGHMTAPELADEMQVAGAALRMRISRLKRKIKNHPGIY